MLEGESFLDAIEEMLYYDVDCCVSTFHSTLSVSAVICSVDILDVLAQTCVVKSFLIFNFFFEMNAYRISIAFCACCACSH